LEADGNPTLGRNPAVLKAEEEVCAHKKKGFHFRRRHYNTQALKKLFSFIYGILINPTNI